LINAKGRCFMTVRWPSGFLLSLLLTGSFLSPVGADERQPCDSLNGARITVSGRMGALEMFQEEPTASPSWHFMLTQSNLPCPNEQIFVTSHGYPNSCPEGDMVKVTGVYLSPSDTISLHFLELETLECS
jgi:hypothetical protein